jgi:hypothetical protein
MKKLVFLALPAAVALAAPLAAQDGNAPASGQVQRAASRRSNRIEPDEIAQAHANTAYDLIQARRPSWLNVHHPNVSNAFNPAVTPEVNTRAEGDMKHAPRFQSEANTDDLIIILDQTQLGNREELKQVPIANVYSVEYLTPTQTRIRLDRSTRDGAIIIHTSATDDPGARPTG